MPPAERRVLMMVDNNVVGDARVLKTAASVAGQGHRVMVLGRRTRATGDVPDVGFTIRLVRVRRNHPDSEAQTYVGRAPFAYRSRAQVEAAEGANRWRRFRTRQRSSAMARTVARARSASEAAPDTPAAQLLMMERLWRALQPVLTDYEEAYRPVIERFRPHVIHAHDFRMIGIAVRAANAARAVGRRRPRVVYDAHEFVPGLEEETPEFLAGNTFYEASHIRSVDRIITVSHALAELLREHHRLDRLPAVTLNAPEYQARTPDPSFSRDVRADCGLAPDVPLVVYSGGVAPRRGLGAVVAGLARVPGVHLAVIANRDELGRALITKSAAEAGVADRLHLLDFVPRLRIIQHLSTADVAVHPLVHLPNHEIALPNKFFDYVFAGLPMIVSDVAHLSDVVRTNRLGQSFPAEDPDGFAAALVDVMAGLPRYRQAVSECPLRAGWTWEAQEPVLAQVYAELTAPRAT